MDFDTKTNDGTAKLPDARVAQLDGLRGIAVALVVTFHYGDPFRHIPVLGLIVAGGWVGVDLFFVMSGFLIGGIVIANKETDNLLSVFYLRRFLRIFPLYYLLLGIVAISISVGWIAHPDYSLAIYAAYIQNIVISLTHNYGLVSLGPTWSLAVEEHFYLLLPVLVVLTPSKYLKHILIAGILVATVTRVGAYALPVDYPRDFARFFTFCRIDDLFYGVLLACLIRNERFTRAIRSRITYFYFAAMLFAASFLVTAMVDHRFSEQIVTSTLGLSLLGPLFICIVVLAVMHEKSWVAKFAKAPPLCWLGIRTYAIYLFHMPAIETISAFFRFTGIRPHGLTVPLAVALTLICAIASWRLIEAPLIKAGHRFKYGNGAQQIVLDAEFGIRQAGLTRGGPMNTHQSKPTIEDIEGRADVPRHFH